MSISYVPGGRFGNNLFQYFTAKVLCKKLNKEYRFNTKFKKQLFEKDLNEEITSDSLSKNSFENITINGYFQINFLHKEKQFINSLLTTENIDRINNEYTIKDIAENKQIVDKDSLKNTLVVHIRLDDFFHQGYNSEIINPYYLKNFILEITNKNSQIIDILFIADKLNYEWEKDYMNILLEIPNSLIIENSSFFKDFFTIHYSSKIILSRSTFGWISVLCSGNSSGSGNDDADTEKQIWFPIQNPVINSNQTIDNLGKNTILFYPTFIKSKNKADWIL